MNMEIQSSKFAFIAIGADSTGNVDIIQVTCLLPFNSVQMFASMWILTCQWTNALLMWFLWKINVITVY